MRLHLVFLFLLAFGLAQAQVADTTFLPLRSLKISIADMLDPFAPAFLLGFEHRIAPRWSLMAEGGFVTSFEGRYLMQKPMSGYKARGEVKRYFEFQKTSAAWYFGLQYMWRTTTIPNEKGLFCLNGCPDLRYVELLYDFSRRIDAGHLSLGFLLKTESRALWEFSVFGGFRHRVPMFEGVPAGARFVRIPNRYFSFRQKDPDTLPSIGCAIRVGFQM